MNDTDEIYAIIDIGSNSVRCLLSNKGENHKELITSRLGEGISVKGELSSNAIKRTVNAVKTLFFRAVAKGATNIYAFATAAVRNSTNGTIFTDLVYKETGLKVDVISGATEAEIGLNGALQGSDGGIIDVGGASTEIIVRKKGLIKYVHSLDTGAVKLFDAYKRDEKKLTEYIVGKIKEYGEIPDSVFYGVGGTATNIAAIDLKLDSYDCVKVHNHEVTIENLQKIKDELFRLTPLETVEKFCVQPKRADIIAGGSLLILEIMKKYNLKSFIASESDNLEGYLMKILRGKNEK